MTSQVPKHQLVRTELGKQGSEKKCRHSVIKGAELLKIHLVQEFTSEALKTLGCGFQNRVRSPRVNVCL